MRRLAAWYLRDGTGINAVRNQRLCCRRTLNIYWNCLFSNHGTEDDESFSYHNGNSDPKGFGHIGFLVDDVYKASEELEKAGYAFQKKPDDGKMKGLAFVKDPDVRVISCTLAMVRTY